MSAQQVGLDVACRRRVDEEEEEEEERRRIIDTDTIAINLFFVFYWT